MTNAFQTLKALGDAKKAKTPAVNGHRPAERTTCHNGGAPRLVVATTDDSTLRYARSALDNELTAVRTAPSGARNQQLNTSAFSLGQLVGAGLLDRGDVEAALYDAGKAAGLEHKEMVGAYGSGGTIASGLDKGIAVPRVITPRPAFPDIAEFDPGHTVPAAPAAAPAEPVDDVEFWKARDVHAHIHAFARARRACPWAVLGVVLARVVTATPVTIALPALVGGEGSLNLFVGLIGSSGSGKGTSERCAAAAVITPSIDTANVGSGEGIGHLFARRGKTGVERIRTACLMTVAEIDTLAALGDRKGATLLPELRKAWSGEDLGFAYADPTKALTLQAHTYRLTMVAGIQPTRASWILDDADGGTPQRFLWMPAADPAAPDEAPECPHPFTWAPPVDLPARDGLTGLRPIEVCATARDTIDAARLARLRGDGDALDGHALQARLKAAAALALLDGHYTVTDDDWALAGDLATVSDRTRAGVVEALKQASRTRQAGAAEAEAAKTIYVAERVEDAAIQRVCRHVVRHLGAAGEAGMARKELTRATSSRDRQHLDAALDRLAEAGQIAASDAEQGGVRWRSR